MSESNPTEADPRVIRVKLIGRARPHHTFAQLVNRIEAREVVADPTVL